MALTSPVPTLSDPSSSHIGAARRANPRFTAYPYQHSPTTTTQQHIPSPATGQLFTRSPLIQSPYSRHMTMHSPGMFHEMNQHMMLSPHTIGGLTSPMLFQALTSPPLAVPMPSPVITSSAIHQQQIVSPSRYLTTSPTRAGQNMKLTTLTE